MLNTTQPPLGSDLIQTEFIYLDTERESKITQEYVKIIGFIYVGHRRENNTVFSQFILGGFH